MDILYRIILDFLVILFDKLLMSKKRMQWKGPYERTFSRKILAALEIEVTCVIAGMDRNLSKYHSEIYLGKWLIKCIYKILTRRHFKRSL